MLLNLWIAPYPRFVYRFYHQADLQINDLFTDLADGRLLIKLLEIISGEKLGRPTIGKMRVHKIENVNKSLDFLHTKVRFSYGILLHFVDQLLTVFRQVRLEAIGAEDVVDGNLTLILGLIWTIILRFQIQDIVVRVVSPQPPQAYIFVRYYYLSTRFPVTG